MTGLPPIPPAPEPPAPRDAGPGLQRIGDDEPPKGPGLAPIPASVQQRLDDPGEGLVKLTG